jgi:hypothetical protein
MVTTCHNKFKKNRPHTVINVAYLQKIIINHNNISQHIPTMCLMVKDNAAAFDLAQIWICRWHPWKIPWHVQHCLIVGTVAKHDVQAAEEPSPILQMPTGASISIYILCIYVYIYIMYWIILDNHNDAWKILYIHNWIVMKFSTTYNIYIYIIHVFLNVALKKGWNSLCL